MAGQKRSANSQSGNHKSKKTRFVEPEEDPAGFEEQVEASLEKSTRRGRIKTDGYDSDSTDDGEGVVHSRKGGGEDMDDMFAAGDDGEEPKEESGGKKEKYMRLGDIEGQEFGEDLDEESASEAEPLDEDDAERRKKAGMGYELSSFNMRDEMEEGKFTEDGTYIRTFDPNVVHDRWMEGVSDKEIKLARRRKRELEKKLKTKLVDEEEELKATGGKSSMERDLLPFLKKGESVLEALQRIGSQSKKSQYVLDIAQEYRPFYVPLGKQSLTRLLTMSKQSHIWPRRSCLSGTSISTTEHTKNSFGASARPASSNRTGTLHLPISSINTSGDRQNLVRLTMYSDPSAKTILNRGITPCISGHLARRSMYVVSAATGGIGTTLYNED